MGNAVLVVWLTRFDKPKLAVESDEVALGADPKRTSESRTCTKDGFLHQRSPKAGSSCRGMGHHAPDRGLVERDSGWQDARVG